LLKPEITELREMVGCALQIPKHKAAKQNIAFKMLNDVAMIKKFSYKKIQIESKRKLMHHQYII
jgi:hypothetical protein